MYRMDLFKRKLTRLQDFMPFGRVYPFNINGIKTALSICKDGSLQVTMRYRGPDLDSSIQEELEMITLRLQDAIASMKTDMVMYFDAQRTPSTSYSRDVYFPDPITQAIDAERYKLFSSGIYFESNFYLTMCWLPPKDRTEQLKELVIEGKEHKKQKAEDILNNFKEQVYKFWQSLRSVNILVEFLSTDELLSYIHSTVSNSTRPLHLPDRSALIDSYLYDTPLTGGLEPMLGGKHQRIISPIKYPRDVVFGMFDRLNKLDFPYRWVTRVYCLSKEDVLDKLDMYKRQWKGKLQSFTAALADVLFRNGASNGDVNDNTVDRLAEIRDSVNAVETDHISFVYYSTMVIVADEDPDLADEHAKEIRQEFINKGFKAEIEDFNAIDAWFSSIPGLTGHNVRRPMISTGNLIHLMPLSNSWAGDGWNKRLNGPPLLYTLTAGRSPFRFNIHVGEIGHTLVVGPTGAGKSVLLNTMEAGFRKYKDARVIVFDKGASSKILTLGVGGNFYNLGKEGGELSFQPLAKIDDRNELQWVQEWLCDYLKEENLEITPERKSVIRDALTTLAGMQPHFRTITGFISFLHDKKLKEAFYPLALSDDKGNPGEYGAIFDSDKDSLTISSWQSFEMESLMNSKRIVGTTLMYIFHRIEEEVKSTTNELSGGPTLIVLDECWVFLDIPLFADKIREWLKTLRKYNASVVFATQSLEDISKTAIFDTILNSCMSRIFLPNATALTDSNKALYKKFGLNDQQINIIAHAQARKDYYYDSPNGSRLFDLALGDCPLTLAYVAVDKKALIKCQNIIDDYGIENFNEKWIDEHEEIRVFPTYN